MSESEARAQALVSGFCISDVRGMLEMPHGTWTDLAICGLDLITIVFRQSVGWEDSLQVCFLRCPTKRGIPKQSPGEE